MGESTSEKLVYLPAKLYVEVIERPKYVCRQCDKQGEQNTVVMAAPAPASADAMTAQRSEHAAAAAGSSVMTAELGLGSWLSPGLSCEGYQLPEGSISRPPEFSG